jgi:transcription initiation factor TFIIIB Brf1 subunit/transcription initiation factor TFIIB
MSLPYEITDVPNTEKHREMFAVLHVDEIARKVGVTAEECTELAARLATVADGSADIHGSPRVLAACAVYMAAGMTGRAVSRASVAEAAGINKQSITDRWVDIAEEAGLNDFVPASVRARRREAGDE